jgi:galactose mutarotase-like enzyme
MVERKVGNTAQLYFAQDVFIAGKNCILVQKGELELLFNKDNALDIVWAKFKGVNLSFLSKNGLNDGQRDFTGNFEGGFLYTCGMDNISSCVANKPIHGSLHYKKAENAYAYAENGIVYVCGDVKETALFGKNLVFKRRYEITANSLRICDTVQNDAFKDTEYVLLYHVNYGYPFLDEGLLLDIPALQSDPLTEIATKRKAEMFTITPPLDENDEDVYYHTLARGQVRLENKNKGILVEMNYDTNDFPVTLEWKSMTSGDYALGIEPSLTRFDKFQMQTIKAKAQKTYQITITFQ